MKIYCTFHPSSVVEGGFQFESYITEDLQRFRLKQLRSPIKKFPKTNARILGFDTEYDPSGSLLTVGIADFTRAKAVETTEQHWKRDITPLLRKAKVIIGHSVAGDLDYLVKNKLAKEDWLRGINVRDSFLLARMVDENRGKGGYNLESLLLSEFNATPWKQPTADLLKKDPDASKWPVELRTERCRIDAWATRLLGEKFLQRAEAEIEEVRERRFT